jgi:hypothetical protein
MRPPRHQRSKVSPSARLALVAALAAALPLGAGSCAYGPSFDNGALECTTASGCPKGYSCGADNTCWKAGEEYLASYLGTWIFATGTLNANCSDDSPLTSPLAGDFITVDSGKHGIVASYYCDWTLHSSADKKTSALDSGQSCTQMTTDAQTQLSFTYNWSGSAFSFSASGLNASASGHISGPFQTSNGGSGTCDVTFSGALLKSSP